LLALSEIELPPLSFLVIEEERLKWRRFTMKLDDIGSLRKSMSYVDDQPVSIGFTEAVLV